MTIYKDSKRIVGTNIERIGASAATGGWKEIGRTTLGSANASMNTTSLSDKRYYMILTNSLGYSGVANSNIRFNSDSGSNYAERVSVSGATDTTGTSYNFASFAHGNTATENFGVGYVSNLSSKEKLWISHNIRQNTAGAGNAPIRAESVGKWANTANAVSGIDILTGSSTTHDSGSETIILGWDPDDTHSTNFWEELATNTASGGGSTQEVTFTAKKYLWFQCYFELSGSTDIPRFQVGNGSFDTGNNYAERFSGNGGTDETQINRSDIHIDKASSKPFFVNGFIINNASQEKLFIIHSVEQNTAGAGNVPTRIENVGKWTNTSNQIDRLRTTFGTDTINAGAIMKVWGSN